MRDPREHIDVLRDRYKGRGILVCALGPSLKTIPLDARFLSQFLTIGVNDIGRYFDPDYVLILDEPSVFRPRHHRRDNTLQHILNTRPKRATVVNSTHREKWGMLLAERHRKVLAAHGCAMPDAGLTGMPPWKDSFWQVHMGAGGSPLTAVSLAGLMGASSVGIIGVDLLDHPDLSEEQKLRDNNYRWGRLAEWMGEQGCDVVNLSRASRLTSKIRKMEFSEWAQRWAIAANPCSP